MSRGPGKVQRRVLAVFEAHPERELEPFQLAGEVYEVPVTEGLSPSGELMPMRLLTRAQVSAVRRALLALAKAGKLVRCGFGCGWEHHRRAGRQYWKLGSEEPWRTEHYKRSPKKSKNGKNMPELEPQSAA
jgi:hypothetical protein